MNKENKANGLQKQEKLPVEWEMGTVAVCIKFSDTECDNKDLCGDVRQMLLAMYISQVEKAG